MPAKSPKQGNRSLFDVMEAYPDERSCIDHLARMRWPNGEVCPWCQSKGRAYRVNDRWKCSGCRRFFSSVRKGTIFEHSKVSLRKWYVAMFLFVSSRKGISSRQLAREIGVTQKLHGSCSAECERPLTACASTPFRMSSRWTSAMWADATGTQARTKEIPELG